VSARALLNRATGLNLTEADAARAVTRRMDALGIEDADVYLRQMAPSELNALIELVVVPESWMFRDADAFAAAVGFVLAAPARVLRIASVPCAGGEEPYSMAMALADAGVPAASTRIDGYDLSTVSIARARVGRYTRNAFRGRKMEFRGRHFTAIGEDYQISEALRAQVEFRQGNLFELDSAVAGGRYDVIFCRNLLIYFDEPTTAAAIKRLDGLLNADGIVFAGYAEVPSFCRNGFSPLPLPGAFALQRGVAPASSTRAGAHTRALAQAAAQAQAQAQAPTRARVAPPPHLRRHRRSGRIVHRCAPRRRAKGRCIVERRCINHRRVQAGRRARARADTGARQRHPAGRRPQAGRPGRLPRRHRQLPGRARARRRQRRRLLPARRGQRLPAAKRAGRGLLAALHLPQAEPLRGAVPAGAAGRTDRRRGAGERLQAARRAHLPA
jgi:chemotaxis protein methyltransferase WspC